MTSPGMPYVCIHTEFDKFPEKKISWHWHSSIEFVYVQEGVLELHIPGQTAALRASGTCTIRGRFSLTVKAD